MRRLAMGNRGGVVLLEVIVALSLLATAGGALVVLCLEMPQAVDGAQRAERELREASDFLTLVTLWPREDLDRRLGEHPQGPWLLEITRESPAVYHLRLRDTLAGDAELLVTAVYRPDTSGVMRAATPRDQRPGSMSTVGAGVP